MYLRFGGMIVTGMVIMYAVMFVGSWEWSHIRFSESRVFMALTMGGAMTLVMLGWMLNMYGDMRLNVAIIALGLLLLIGGAFLDRSQTTVQDTGFMSSMIPHHSGAILMCREAKLADPELLRLCGEIVKAQRAEIEQMEVIAARLRAQK